MAEHGGFAVVVASRGVCRPQLVSRETRKVSGHFVDEDVIVAVGIPRWQRVTVVVQTRRLNRNPSWHLKLNILSMEM